MTDRGNRLFVRKKDFVDASLFRALVDTTGFKGGDAGHGSYLTIKFEDLGCTVWRAKGEGSGGQLDSVTIQVQGDAEIRNMVRALRWMADELQKELGKEKTT